jgi:predicted XRE-type DNA-binding protein
MLDDYCQILTIIAMMSDGDFELIRGSGNVFRDFGNPNAEVLQLKAILAGKIIDVLDEQKITVRRAHELTGFAAVDFSRVRQAKLHRFTVRRGYKSRFGGSGCCPTPNQLPPLRKRVKPKAATAPV